MTDIIKDFVKKQTTSINIGVPSRGPPASPSEESNQSGCRFKYRYRVSHLNLLHLDMSEDQRAKFPK